MMQGSNVNDRVPFLDTLPEGVRADLEQLGSRRSYAVGDVLISEGDRVHDLVLLHEGLVKVIARLDGDDESLVDIGIAGDVVGEMAAMSRGSRSATVVACGEVIATVIPERELKPFLIGNPEVWSALDTVLCGRLRRAVRWRLEFRGYPVLVRLARVLVELAVSYGRPEWGGVRINVSLSQSELAALTGSKTNTVQKMLAQLGKEGLVRTGEKYTYVRNLDRLRGGVAQLRAPSI
ncbi:Crp/Fnr family transcriptional regulator [Streptomyces lasiicapitis]|uniref:Crp/Fnr family transcriptional regulator n=1 Tax=Streptomyces lasiicapitis TaxID=1923961 RepID=UPI0033221C22